MHHEALVANRSVTNGCEGGAVQPWGIYLKEFV